MNRRRFLQAVGVLASTPALSPVLTAFASQSATAVPAATYKWAELIVRAHKTSTPAMLQRTLQVTPAVAEALQSQLIANGVLGSQANAWGMHRAVDPLFDGVFPKQSFTSGKVREVVKKVSDRVFDGSDRAQDDTIEDSDEDRADALVAETEAEPQDPAIIS